MSKIREVLVGAPGWCGLYDADRWAKVAGLAFDEEVKDPQSVGARLPDETVADRLRTVLAWRNYVEGTENQALGAYVQNLIVFTALSIDKNTGKPYHVSSWENLKTNLTAEESKYPKVAEVLTVAEASLMDYWN